MALICTYAPNSFNEHFYDSLASIWLDPPQYPLLIGGDFNAVWLHDIDWTGVTETRDQRLVSSALQKLANDYGVINICHMMNPFTREFSFFSAQHKTFSRIDYIFVSKTLFSDIRNTNMIPISLSNHRAVLCTFPLRAGHPKAAWWHFNTTLLQTLSNKNLRLNWMNISLI